MTEIQISSYYPGVVGQITQIHAVYYHEHWGFDASFETQVGRELSDFVGDFDEDRDGLWVATCEGRFAGSIAIDGRNAETEGARLRWFIVVTDFQKAGIGKELIFLAVEFCKKKTYPGIFLWTFEGLDRARRLYESQGFRLIETHDVAQWGQRLTEQKFELSLQDRTE